MPVFMLKQVMPAAEYQNWREFHKETPLDDQSNHHRPIAYLQSAMVNLQIPRGKPRVRLEDYLLYRQKREEEQDIDSLLLGNGW